MHQQTTSNHDLSLHQWRPPICRDCVVKTTIIHENQLNAKTNKKTQTMKQYNAIQDTNKMKYYVLYHEGRTVSLKWQGMKFYSIQSLKN